MLHAMSTTKISRQDGTRAEDEVLGALAKHLSGPEPPRYDDGSLLVPMPGVPPGEAEGIIVTILDKEVTDWRSRLKLSVVETPTQ